MTRIALVALLALCSACEAPAPTVIDVRHADLTGTWYGVYASGAQTTLFVSEFAGDGRTSTRYYTCLSKEVRNFTVRRGSWSLDGNVITLIHHIFDDDGTEIDPFVHSYRIYEQSTDLVRYSRVDTNEKFWMERKWTERDYDCTTTAADINADRQAALDDGRADPHNPLISSRYE